MDKVSRIAVFLEVAKHQSFAAAARALGMTGSAVSKQIQNLEDQLDVLLLHRTTRKVTLTEEGAIYYERARRALEDLQEAENFIQEFKARPTGVLKVNIPISFGQQYLTQPIAKFAKQYPDVKLEIDLDDRKVNIVDEGYDVVVRIGALEDSSLIARKLASCPILLCASPEYIRDHGAPQVPKDLKDHKALIYTQHGQFAQWTYQGLSGDTGSVDLQSTLKANSGEMLLEGCLEGVALCIIPIFLAAPYLQSGKLVHLMPDYKTAPERNIYAMFPQNRHLSARVKLFVDMLTEAGKALPWSYDI
jgi:DNA-binding transcriptional LysR family regulator